MGGLFFDLHFNLANTHNELLDFLKDYRHSDVKAREYYDSINFVKTPLPLIAEDLTKEQEKLFYKELEGMYNEIRLELLRRLNVLLKVADYNDELITDWRLVSLFSNLVIEMRQAGMFTMINDFLDQYKMRIGRRIQSTEKYQPFTPIITANNAKNHELFDVRAPKTSSLIRYRIWLKREEKDRIVSNHNRLDPDKRTLMEVFPDNILVEKLIPKMIAENSFDFHVKKIDEKEAKGRLKISLLDYDL